MSHILISENPAKKALNVVEMFIMKDLLLCSAAEEHNLIGGNKMFAD